LTFVDINKISRYGAYIGLKLERTTRIHALQDCWTLWRVGML